MERPYFQFRWNPVKDRANRRKHGVSFDAARGVFLDPLATTIPDPEHSDNENRWITLGEAADAGLLVVVHTYRETDTAEFEIRIITARQANRRERRDYEGGHP